MGNIRKLVTVCLFAILGPYSHPTPISGSGDAKHLKHLWCGYYSKCHLGRCGKTLIHTYMDIWEAWENWLLSVGPFSHLTPTSGSGDAKHLKWLWCGYYSKCQLGRCCKMLIHKYMDMGNIWKLVTVCGLQALDLDHIIISPQHLAVVI